MNSRTKLALAWLSVLIVVFVAIGLIYAIIARTLKTNAKEKRKQKEKKQVIIFVCFF